MSGKVAVLGTGIMGAAMARNLRAAGMEVRAWNRTRAKAEPLADDGITVSASPAEAAEGADFLLTMLADAGATEEAVGDGVLSHLAGDAVWIQTATVGIEGNDQLAALAGEHGIAYVDAPVLGTRQPAESGALIVLASGPDKAREWCKPVFDAVGQKTLWLGAAGAGSRLKLVVNAWILGLVGALAETIALSEATGVDPESFFEAIGGGPLDLPYAQTKGRMMVSHDYPTSFSAKLAAKDADLVLEAARQSGLDSGIIRAVTALFNRALESGRGDEDMAAIHDSAHRDGR